MTLADCRRPLFACRMIYRSSPTVAVFGRPPPTFLTAVPVVWNAFQARETTLLLIPNSAATLVTSRFSVHPDNRGIFIWRDRGSRNNPVFVHESVRFGGGGVLVYGGISIDGRTDLYIIRDGPLTAHRYRDEILKPIVVPYIAAIGDDFILMDDNCRSHRANLVEDFLFEEGIVRIERPACSPDMNPIEHVWDALGRRVAGRQPPPQTLQELERALLEEGDRIPQLVFNSLIESMPQRCSTLLAVRENHTP
ncbi:transposable element Tcb2 transposase, partial [Trichonephila clavipes]